MSRLWQRLWRRLFWNRLRRLWHEPRIRLPASGLRPGALHPGDRLQIGSRLWRVESRGEAGIGVAFELAATEGLEGRARLRCSSGRWLLAPEDRDAVPEIDLDPAAVIHFPVVGTKVARTKTTIPR